MQGEDGASRAVMQGNDGDGASKAVMQGNDGDGASRAVMQGNKPPRAQLLELLGVQAACRLGQGAADEAAGGARGGWGGE